MRRTKLRNQERAVHLPSTIPFLSERTRPGSGLDRRVLLITGFLPVNIARRANWYPRTRIIQRKHVPHANDIAECFSVDDPRRGNVGGKSWNPDRALI